MTPLPIAVIGAGRWGRNLIRAVQALPEFSLTAVCDADPAALSDRGVATVVDSAALWDRPDVVAVIVASPPNTHFSLVHGALEAGRHVLCEKPLAFSWRSCRELELLAIDTGLTVMVDCLPVYLDEIQEARDTVDWEAVQEIHCLRISSRRPAHDVSPLWDLLPHDLAVLDFWYGSLPECVEFVSLTADDVFVRGTYDDGPRVELRAGYGDTAERVIRVSGDGVERRFLQRQTEPEPLHVVLRHFAECVRYGTRPLTGLTHAIATARLLEGAKSCLLF